LLVVFFVLLFSSGCYSQEFCKSAQPVKTPSGDLVLSRCNGLNRAPTRKYVSVGGVKVLESSYLSEVDFDKNRTHWIFRGDALPATGCPDRLYLVDLTVNPVKVVAFGIKKACNEFHWASWGDKRSVIALKNNVKFSYESGKMTLPANGEQLWKAIEPPHAGAGLNLEDARAFSEDVPLPEPHLTPDSKTPSSHPAHPHSAAS
jgi:hypothetical protein